MPDFPEETNVGSRRKGFVFAGFSVILVLGAGVYIFASGFSAPGFLRDTVGIVSQTLQGVLGSGSNKEKVFEISLDAPPQKPAERASEVEGSISPPTIRGTSAENPSAAGTEDQKRSENAPSVSRATTPLTASTSQSVFRDSATPAPDCDFASAAAPTRQVIFNEIAWTGSPLRSGETATAASNNEWMELKNVSQANIDLSGWQILDESEKFNVLFEQGAVPANGFFLLERSDDDSVLGIPAEKIYNGALANSGMWLRIFDDHCVLVDEMNAEGGWPGGDNASKKTLERNALDFDWHTSEGPGGTPKKENSKPTQATSVDPGAKYGVGVSLNGDGLGVVKSSPAGIVCGLDCSESFLIGAAVTLTATSSPDSSFLGWSGACAGTSDCKLVVTSTIAVVASFRSLVPPPMSAPASIQPSQEESSLVNHLVISALQTTGGAGLTTNDFVKIFNPLAAQFNLKGHRLVKRTKTGSSDTSLKSWTSDTLVPAGGYYLWANSSFATISETPNATTTGSIADDNGVAIRFGEEDTGTIIDSVAWGAAANAFIESAPYPTNPIANQILKRKFAEGTIKDTDNNVSDFEIQ